MALNLDQLAYHPLERLTVARPVGRIDYIRSRCKGLRVLDLGAYDETEVEKPQHQSWRWLHAEEPRKLGRHRSRPRGPATSCGSKTNWRTRWGPTCGCRPMRAARVN